jgi:hypothetical protein
VPRFISDLIAAGLAGRSSCTADIDALQRIRRPPTGTIFALAPIRGRLERPGKEGLKMLWTIFVILLVLWLLGLVSGYTLGGFVHVLLVIAVVILIINLVSGRRVV